MFKKILALLLAVISIFGLFSCKEPQNNENPPDEFTGIDTSTTIANIVENGSSEYKIVTAIDANQAEEYAASEFANYINKVSGVTLEIIKEDTMFIDEDAKIISIGKTEALNSCNFDVDYSKLNGDGFILKTYGNGLYINGANDRGTLYGVYDFMEKILGVRFLEIRVEHVPESDVVPLYKMNVTEIPAFKYRVSLTPSVYQGYDVASDQLAWSVKERNTSEFLPNEEKYGGTININKDIPQTHNNLTYVMQGSSYSAFNSAHGGNCKNMFYFGTGTTPRDICYTNGIEEDGSIASGFNTASAYVEGMKKYILKNPDADYYTCGQEDIRDFCTCQSCSAVTKKYNNNTTAAIIRFYNAVAREVQEWANQALEGKKINIVIFSYYFSAKAPVTQNDNGEYVPYDDTVVLADNIIVRFADIVTNYSYSFLDSKNTSAGYGPEYLKQWKAISNRCWYWGYMTNHNFFFGYCGTTRKIQETLLGLKDANCEYAFMQYNNNEFNDWKTIMENYVCSKMLWNPNQDVNALRDEFIELYFGIASEDVKGIVKAIDDNYYDALSRDSSVYWQLFEVQNFPLELWQDIMERIEVAQEKVRAQTDKDAKTIEQEIIRLERIKLTPLFAMMYKREVHFYDDDEKNAVTTEFFEVCERLGVKWYGEHKSINDLKSQFPIIK